MKNIRLPRIGLMLGLMFASPLSLAVPAAAQSTDALASGEIKHVLLLSIDGMHAVDFYNCANGVEGVNGGEPYCPNLAGLRQHGINYVSAVSSKPSDSFPGLTALISGATPKSSGIYYDVAYDRSLDPPAVTTNSGLAAGPCTPYGVPAGTTTDNTQGIDYDASRLNGGAPGAKLTDGGFASIDPKKLVRDPAAGCAPVYPYNFIRVNTIFGVVHAAGGYTAWSDKRPSYAFVAGPGGKGLDDFFGPEVASTVVPLPGVTTSEGASCATVRDPANTSSWISSYDNVQCFDALHVNAVLNQIAGKTHNGEKAKVPAIFGTNFQSVFVGQAVNAGNAGTGGYLNAAAVPGDELLKEIEFVDASIGDIVHALKEHGIYESTLLIVTAKHGEAPTDPQRFVEDLANSPATLLGTALPYPESPLNPTGIGSTEDDVSVLWLKDSEQTPSAVELLEKNASLIGLGQIFYGPTLALNYNVPGTGPGQDPRSPDMIVTPNYGVTYVSGPSVSEDHGGFGHDDTNVLLLLANPALKQSMVSIDVSTTQVAPTILKVLGLDPQKLDGVRLEGTTVLPRIPTTF
jgi:predicted AlkP superfamily pyrophosphatase or phosphodiesterase